MNNINWLEISYLVFYFFILFVLSMYGAHRYYLTYLYFRYRHHRPAVKTLTLTAAQPPLPVVTIQLPIYNEKYVVARLIDAVCQIEYPREKLQIQVLDDSTDETQSLAQTYVKECQSQGFDISYIHRVNRQGFKAGALANGLTQARGEYVTIFDADFIPNSDFLVKTLPHFESKEIAMIQVRWGHINRDYSALTQAQSILLDGHFIMEHSARNRSGCFFNFNGTAGIWRKQAIFDAGGWSHDTLTEDLDLSYRAQLKGWKFLFLQEVISPGELPVDMNAFKNQQHRWAKGSIQTALKLLPQVLRSSYPWRVKIEAFFHLTANFAYPLLVLLSLLMPLSIFIRYQHGWRQVLLLDLPSFFAATFSIAAFYSMTQRELGEATWQRLKFIPFVMSLGIGLSVSNAKAVIEALMGRESPFTRTPKHGVSKKGDKQWIIASYRGGKGALLPWLEIAMAAYYAVTIYVAVLTKHYLSIPFLFIFQIGFLYVGALSLFQGQQLRALFVSTKDPVETVPSKEIAASSHSS